MEQLKLFKRTMTVVDGCWNCKHESTCIYDLDDCLDAKLPTSKRRGIGDYYYNDWEAKEEE